MACAWRNMDTSESGVAMADQAFDTGPCLETDTCQDAYGELALNTFWISVDNRATHPRHALTRPIE